MKRKLILIMTVALTTWIIQAVNPHVVEVTLTGGGLLGLDGAAKQVDLTCSGGGVRLAWTGPGGVPTDKIAVYQDAACTIPISGNEKTWNPAPATASVWVKGVKVSGAMDDVHMTLEALQAVATPATVKFTVFSVDSIRFHKNPFMTGWKAIDQVYKNIGVYTDHTAWFAVNTTPSGLTIPKGQLTWGGLASGTTPSVLVTFKAPNFSEVVTVTCGGTTKSAWVAIRDQPSGMGEVLYCFAWPVDTAIAWGLNLIDPDPTAVTEPSAWASATYPGEQHNTVGDAARHAYWTCLLRRYTGAGYALGVTTQHEVSGAGPCTETIMDLNNNLMGIDIEGNHTHTSGFGCCRAAVQSAVSAGTLWYLDSSYGAENTAADALLQPTNH